MEGMSKPGSARPTTFELVPKMLGAVAGTRTRDAKVLTGCGTVRTACDMSADYWHGTETEGC